MVITSKTRYISFWKLAVGRLFLVCHYGRREHVPIIKISETQGRTLSAERILNFSSCDLVEIDC